MFRNTCYITCGVENEVPIEIQIFLWAMIETLRNKGIKLDYLQVFRLSIHDDQQKIIHTQEQPDYREEIIVPLFDHPVEAKIFVIDDGDHSTMLLANEY